MLNFSVQQISIICIFTGTLENDAKNATICKRVFFCGQTKENKKRSQNRNRDEVMITSTREERKKKWKISRDQLKYINIIIYHSLCLYSPWLFAIRTILWISLHCAMRIVHTALWKPTNTGFLWFIPTFWHIYHHLKF